MNIYKTELFPYLEGDSLAGKEFEMTIKDFGSEMMPDHKGADELKYTLQFNETDKSLILNKTNAKRLAVLFGPETNEWKGKRIVLYTEEVKAFGKLHNAIRIKGTSDDKPEETAEDIIEQLGF